MEYLTGLTTIFTKEERKEYCNLIYKWRYGEEWLENFEQSMTGPIKDQIDFAITRKGSCSLPV